MADVETEVEAGRYTCPLCPERFESVGDKRRHMKDAHKSVKR